MVKDYEGIENLMDEGNTNRSEISKPACTCKGIASIARITEAILIKFTMFQTTLQ